MLAIYQLKKVIISFFGFALFAASPIFAQSFTNTLNVTGGQIKGLSKNGISSFLGVPFAAPPIGDLRWKPPQPIVPWQSVKSTISYSPACAPNADWIPNEKSEDCLYLNIWAPENAKNLPVIFWIHGGGMYGGTAAVPVQDGENLAKRGAIVVTINYRLGILGFFSHQELSAESPNKVSGNQGILDQIAALNWVKSNITQFGGNPNKVTIMGNSAGGESVGVLLASPLSKNLFHGAVAASGNDALPISASEYNRFNNKTKAEAKGIAFSKSIGVESLAALRKLPVSELQKHFWLPRVYVDDYLLKNDQTTLYQKQLQNDVPLLVGWTAEEGKDLAPEILGTREFTYAKHISLIKEMLGYEPTNSILSAYSAKTDMEANNSINKLTNDWWGWRMVYWAALQKEYGKSKSYVYYFVHKPTPPEGQCYYGCGAGHGVEIQYLFDNLKVDNRNWQSDDLLLANQLADTIVEFARFGNPNGKNLPKWQSFNGLNSSIKVIGDDEDLKQLPIPDFSIFPQIPKKHK